MKWKDLYKKCNSKKYSVITNIKQPATLIANFSNFVNKYKIILICTFTIFIIIALTMLNLKLWLCCLCIILFLFISLIYYNTFKIEFKKDLININIMFREITLKQDDIINIYISRQKSYIFLVVPFYYYSINLLYNENNRVNGYTFSTIMAKKEDILKFFQHFKFKVLEVQKEEEKKEDIQQSVIRFFYTALAVLLGIVLVVYLLGILNS